MLVDVELMMTETTGNVIDEFGSIKVLGGNFVVVRGKFVCNAVLVIYVDAVMRGVTT